LENASFSKPKDYTRLIRQITIRLASWRTKHSQFELFINLETINSKRLVYQKMMMIMEMEKDWVHFGRNPETFGCSIYSQGRHHRKDRWG
jgi:hypothetical protein